MSDADKQIEEDRKRLDELEEDIEEARHNTDEWREQHEQHFIDEGADEDESEVDNTIVPPG